MASLATEETRKVYQCKSAVSWEEFKGWKAKFILYLCKSSMLCPSTPYYNKENRRKAIAYLRLQTRVETHYSTIACKLYVQKKRPIRIVINRKIHVLRFQGHHFGDLGTRHAPWLKTQAVHARKQKYYSIDKNRL